MNKLLLGIDLIKSMGIKPIAYRVLHTFKKKSGLLKASFPTKASNNKFISLNDWKNSSPKFFFQSKEELKHFALPEAQREELAEEVNRIKEGYIKFFNGEWRFMGENYNWITNPATNYPYDINNHWTELETLDEKKGDIKFVWEKSRFSYLYSLIRYDYHFNEDQSEYVFSEIISWINKNPLNMGPNFSCSQEISIRILNWIFALHYYKNSSSLTEDCFNKIINSIYDQSRHVEEHLNFSLLTVRNNHAITECLLLYTVGLLFPFYKESKRWKAKGKKYLEQEGLYQIYEDGSYLQFSMNYERVVLQLYTWGFFLGRANGESFSSKLTERLKAVVNFLYQSQDTTTGMLPNYGSNDGALFFPLNNQPFRDYRPQLNVMNYFLNGKSLFEGRALQEDLFWFANETKIVHEEVKKTTSSFNKGGYYVLRNSDKFSFIRCGNHPDRPLQADNLHLDVWFKGKNILRDAGSYKYNASKEDVRYFMGTASHNTVMINDADQMLKGGRFLWFYWSKALDAKISETEDQTIFEGSIKAFNHVSKNIIHRRIVKQFKKEAKWEIVDTISGTNKPSKQIWNISPEFFEQGFEITCTDKDCNNLQPFIKEGSYSYTYGVKESSKQIIFESNKGSFHTIIKQKA